MKPAFPLSTGSRSKRAGCRRRWLAVVLALGALSSHPVPAADGPPPLMSFQTRVLDSTGVPLANGSKEVFFRVYGVEAGDAAPLWAENQTVSVKDGYISVILGQGGPVAGQPNGELSALFTGIGDTERYIEIEIDGTKISPRLRLLPSAYSFVSGVALRLVANSVEASMIRDGAVGNAALANNAVTEAKITAGSVSTAKIAASAVTTAKIEDGAVTTAKIADLGVATADLANGAVTSEKINDGAIIAADLAVDSVNSAKIAASAVGTPEIEDGAVTTSKIADTAVTSAKIANGAVGATKLQSGMFTTATYSVGTTTAVVPYDTTVSYADFYPVISSVWWGDGDLQENGTGDLGGIRLIGQNGKWHIRANLRTHNDHADARVRILWIPRALVTGTIPGRDSSSYNE